MIYRIMSYKIYKVYGSYNYYDFNSYLTLFQSL